MFKVGNLYQTVGVGPVRIVGKTDANKGYETVYCRNGHHRYNRKGDYGRATGTSMTEPSSKNLIPSATPFRKLYKFKGRECVHRERGMMFLNYISKDSIGNPRTLTVHDSAFPTLKYVGVRPSTILGQYVLNSPSRFIERSFLMSFENDIPQFEDVNGDEYIKLSSVIYLEMLDD